MNKNVKRMLLLLIDAFISLIACIATTILATDSYIHTAEKLVSHWCILIAFTILCRVLFSTYSRIWHHADVREYVYLIVAEFSAFILTASVELILPFIGINRLTLRYVAITFAISALLIVASRLTYKFLREFVNFSPNSSTDGKHVVIIGAGRTGSFLVKEMRHDTSNKYIPYGFFDKNSEKVGQTVQDIKVLGTVEEMPEILKNSPVKEIILAVPQLSDSERIKLMNICLSTGLEVTTYEHPFAQPNNKRAIDFHERIRNIDIEDLLFRKQISLDNPNLYNTIRGKTVLVTGGGGSIGSEICRQIAAQNPKHLVILDIYENTAYEVQQELIAKYGKSLNMSVVIASVSDEAAIDNVFKKFQPDLVYHAAAHKHVPLMEDCASEAVKNNVFGTYTLFKTAKKYKAQKCVLISTDKAVNPTNVMGATKRMCEMLMYAMNDGGDTQFSAVRFGNVLGSHGSVVPFFQNQIERGGPVTITDMRIERFFMTISEAVALTLQTSVMDAYAEIFVLDMGSPIKIIDLAKSMISLAGLKPYEDIEIIEIGLRPGEKLYEELLMSDTLERTENQKVFIDREAPLTKEEIEKRISILQEAVESGSDTKVVEALAQCVETFSPQMQYHH